jgi:hypothetical protein
MVYFSASAPNMRHYTISKGPRPPPERTAEVLTEPEGVVARTAERVIVSGSPRSVWLPRWPYRWSPAPLLLKMPLPAR